MNAESKVSAEHLKRAAYLYIRQSTLRQVLENTESRERQYALRRRAVVIFFPGEYAQDPTGGSHLRLFGSIPSPRINNPYYRATNLDHYRL